jgi:hypothetical protein
MSKSLNRQFSKEEQMDFKRKEKYKGTIYEVEGNWCVCGSRRARGVNSNFVRNKIKIYYMHVLKCNETHYFI